MSGMTITTFDGHEVEGASGPMRSRAPRAALDDSAEARRAAVRGGVVCGRQAPVLRVAPVTDIGGRRRAAVRQTAMAEAAPRPLRLTRRGRVVLILLPAAALLAAVLVTAAGPLAEASNSSGGHIQTVTVHDGDTLWSIAERMAPSADPRDVVAEIERVNDMTDAVVQAGQTIAVPSAYATK